MPKAKTLQRINQKNQLVHSDYLKQLKQLKDKYIRTLKIPDETCFICRCWCCCECDETTIIASRKKVIKQIETEIDNLKCGCGCN